MEPADAVKLVFQSVLGCGHLLRAETECAADIQRERAKLRVNAREPAATFIGGGLCRMNLSSPSVHTLAPERVARMMALTAARVKGNRALLEAGLDELRALAEDGHTPFSPEMLNRYLAAYREAGYPVVSHSARYREAYSPAYRVVLADFAPLVSVVAATDARLAASGRTVVALDGDCAAGKSTLGGLLAEVYETRPIQMDDFFLPFEMRTPRRMGEPGGNVHYERFETEVLRGLLAGGDLRYRRFDCATGGYLPQCREAAAVWVIEGSYSHHPRFCTSYHALGALKVFAGVEAAEQLKRLALRCPDKLERFRAEWIPLEKSYFEAYDIKEQADIVLLSVPWGDEP